MKIKLLSAIFISLLIGFSFSSCKKTDDKKDKTTAEKIQGTWHLDTDIYHDFFDNEHYYDTTTGGPNDIIEFRSDGKVYLNIDGETDTTVYEISGESKLIIAGNVSYDIKTLTETLLVMYSKQIVGSDYTEETMTLKR
jgi:hypothetical protein